MRAIDMAVYFNVFGLNKFKKYVLQYDSSKVKHCLK